MPKQDHCEICDYTENEGSAFGGAMPYANGKVRRYFSELLCDACIAVIEENRRDLEEQNEEDERDASAVSVRRT